MDSNKSPQDFPYKTHLNILRGPLELIDVQKLADACADKWYNQTLCKVNDSVVRLAVLEGEYRWHEHKDIDEGFVVPKGVRHRTRAPERTVILIVERADIVPTGD